ncbi:hypothetical protein [Halolamina salina]|uniref:Major facilitator superfamily (MFS) profile domain-containing protein n=1 Tax=Halolamina salina TaxID=1220023 RepID=A0ABD6BA61_9EURY
MSEFVEAIEAAFALIIGGIVMLVFGSVATSELFNFTLMGVLYLFAGIVGVVLVTAVAVQTLFR